MSKVQSFRSLMNEMRDVARGKKAAPRDAARSSFEVGRSPCAIAYPG